MSGQTVPCDQPLPSKRSLCRISDASFGQNICIKDFEQFFVTKQKFPQSPKITKKYSFQYNGYKAGYLKKP